MTPANGEHAAVAHRPTCAHGVSLGFVCNDCSVRSQRVVEALGASNVEQMEQAVANGRLPWWAVGAVRTFIVGGACNCKSCKERRTLIKEDDRG